MSCAFFLAVNLDCDCDLLCFFFPLLSRDFLRLSFSTKLSLLGEEVLGDFDRLRCLWFPLVLSALGCIQTKAVNYQREHKNKKQSVDLQALRLLRVSTRDSVTPAAYQFLASLGIAATEAATAYTLLVGVYEKAQRHRVGMETLSKLKEVIASGETSGDLRTRRNELYRLMRELQERKKLQQLVSRACTAVRRAKTVAKHLVEHWDRVSSPTGATEEECVAYLKALGVEQRQVDSYSSSFPLT